MALSRHRALLMDDAIRALPLWFRKSCILWYDPKRQGLTNKDIGTDNWKLKNLMDKETCYPYNWAPYKNGTETIATVNKLTIGECYDFACLLYPSSEYHGRIKVTNLESNQIVGHSGMLRIYRAKSSDNSVVGDAIIIDKDGIYDINLDPIEGGNRIYFYIPGDGVTLETPIIIEQLPTSKGDMKLVNFGKYVFDFTKFKYNDTYADESTVTIESNKITILNNSSSTASLVITSSTNTSTTPFRIKITGIEPGYRIRMGQDNKIAENIQTNFWEFTQDGIYTIYTKLTEEPWNFGIIYNKIGDCNVVIEELPEPSSCGRGRYLDTPFSGWSLLSNRSVDIKDTSIKLLSSQFHSYTNNGAITFLFHGLSKTSLSHKYKISGIDPDKYEIWFGNDQRQGYITENVLVKATKDGIYTVPWADCTLIRNNGTRCIGIHRKEPVSGNSVTDTNINITIEQVPEYEDALVFDGVDDYAILDGYMDDIYDHFYCINRRVVLDKSLTGREVIASSTYAQNRHFEVYGPDWYSQADAQYGDQAWYGPSYINTNSKLKLLTRNLIQHTLCTPENLQYYSQWGVSGGNTNYSIKELENSNYKNDKYCISFQSDLSRPQGLITDSVLFPFEKGVTYTLSFDANVEGATDLPLNYIYFICNDHDNSSTMIYSNIIAKVGEWKRYSLTYTFPTSYEGTPPAGKILIGSNRTNSVWTLNIKNIKLEIGNKATPYEPALEDFNIKPSRKIINKFPTAKVSNNQFQESFNSSITARGNQLVMANVLNSNQEVIGNFPTNLALYSFLLFNRNLTTEEVQWVEENIIPPLPEELSSVYAEGYWKDYTFWRNTDIWRDDIIPDLFVYSGKDYKSVINTDYCPKPVGLYSAKGKTNADTDKDILYDLSGNGNHIKLHNVAFNGMDGYGGFPFKENYIGTVGNCTKISYNKWHITPGGNYSTPIIHGLNPGTYKLNIKITVNSGNPNLWAYDGPNYQCLVPLTEGINHIEITSTDMTWIALGCDRSNSGTGDYVVELLPEYQDGLIFNGTNAYGITDIIDKEFKDYTVIVKRDRLNNIGVTAALDNFNSTDTAENSTFILESANYSDVNNYGIATIINNLTDFYNQKYIWMTPTNFCNIPISRGTNIVSNQILQLSCSYAGNLQNSNIVFYSLALFDKKLTPQQIEWFIKNKM